MKAILVIDVPMWDDGRHLCNECPIWNRDRFLCEYDFNMETKGCPLKPMPEKKELANYLPFDDYPQQTRFMDFVNGYNACLEEIEK